jgi:hypothetical protein
LRRGAGGAWLLWLRPLLRRLAGGRWRTARSGFVLLSLLLLLRLRLLLRQSDGAVLRAKPRRQRECEGRNQRGGQQQSLGLGHYRSLT